jgi:hypothetical protein
MFEFQECTAASCVRQVKGKKTYVNFLIESECRHHKANTCKYPKHIRHDPKPQTFTKGSGNVTVSPETVCSTK